MHKGQRVYFGRPNGEKTLGEVVSINPKSVKVKQLEARGGHPIGTPWRVAPSMVTPADDVPNFAGTGPIEGVRLVKDITPTSGPATEHSTARRPELDIMREIRMTYGRLSPENLSCDGELPRSEVNRRRTALNRQLKGLFTELGRQVDESEVYDYMEKNAPPMGYMQGRGAS